MSQSIPRDHRSRRIPLGEAWEHIFALVFASVVGAALTVPSALANARSAQTAQTLSQVKKVYVGSLGDKQGATDLRDKLIRQLRKTRGIQVAPSPSEADAIITGTGEIWIKEYIRTNPKPSPWNRQPVYGGYLYVELKGDANETLWTYRSTPGKFVWSDIAQDLANRSVKKLLADLEQRGRLKR